MKWKVASKKSDDLVEQLLINRGIAKGNQEKFFNPKIVDYKADLEIKGTDKALARIERAIKSDELIVIFGDYDVDGVCASAILYKGLTSIGGKVLPYIPHSELEGYGLSSKGLEFAKDSGASVVITVDNGIVANEAAKYAKQLGLDLIITDHHVASEKLPDAYEIVHSTNMCGAGVAWCLIRKLIEKDLEKELLQFVAIATVCDLIPLINLGRAFVYEGLKILNQTKNPGLLALILEAGINSGNIGSYEIGYVIGPRINAIGRLEHAIDALRLLCTKDPIRAGNLAKLLSEANKKRQKITESGLEIAKLLVKKENKIHVLASEEWIPGIVGLIAGKITEEYYRPSIAISIQKEISKASARSIEGVNIIKIIREFADILVGVGGHPGAAGFSIKTADIKIFQKRIEEYGLTLPDEEKILKIDSEIKIQQITKSCVETLQKFQPFGFKNPNPILVINQVKASDIKTVGAGKHLKFKIDNVDAIAFNMGDMEKVINNQLINLAFTPEFNTFNGVEKIQLNVRDIKLN